MRLNGEELARLLDDGVFALAADPARPRSPPSRAAEVPFLNFAELDNAVAKLGQSAAAFDKVYAHLESSDDVDAQVARERLNAMLTRLEQSLADPRGLPGREWYQHMLYAPGVYTGYGVKTLPGIREAIEQRRWDEANRYMGVVSHALNAYSGQLDDAISIPQPTARGSVPKP
jgi:N-acetylated-alpha-linked acidic dipeptidase